MREIVFQCTSHILYPEDNRFAMLVCRATARKNIDRDYIITFGRLIAVAQNSSSAVEIKFASLVHHGLVGCGNDLLIDGRKYSYVSYIPSVGRRPLFSTL